MRNLSYCIIGLLFLSHCKPKDKYVYTPIAHQSNAPGHLVKQHEQLLAKAKSLTESNDSTAIKLYELMEYHFSEEEQYVFPALAILPLLAGGNIPENRDTIIDLTMRFKSNSAKLIAEHQMIKALIDEYRLKSKSQNDINFEELEKELAEHANAEEEIYFPASVVAGEYLKLIKTDTVLSK